MVHLLVHISFEVVNISFKSAIPEGFKFVLQMYRAIQNLPLSTNKRLVTGGGDNSVKVWREESGTWIMEDKLEGHTDWVRDVAWACSIGLPISWIASCSE